MSLVNLLSQSITTTLQAYKVANDDLTSDDFFDALRIASIDSFMQVFPENDAATLESLISPRAVVDGKKKPSKKIVRGYIDGCFDIMHSGHYNAVRQAKALCDVLVVGVHSDAEIMRNKGPPVMNETERLAAAKACKWADEVVFDTPYDPNIALLDSLDCDFGVHGDDMPNNPDGTQAYADLREANRLRIIKRTEGVSTTDLVGRLLLMTKDHLSTERKSVGPVLASAPEDGSILLEKSDLESEQKETNENVSKSVTTTASPRSSQMSQLSEDVLSEHHTQGITGFLPTTWRIVQFSNFRKPKPTDKVIYIDGAFDLFHVGHINILEKAKALGTFLYVGIHDDATVNKYKGRNYPIMNLHERVLNVLSCKYVDDVIIGAPLVITQDLITVLGVHTIAASSNTQAAVVTSKNKNPVDPYAYPKKHNMFVEIESTGELDTEAVISRIVNNRLAYEKRNEGRVKKELTYIETRQNLEEV